VLDNCHCCALFIAPICEYQFRGKRAGYKVVMIPK
jgi:hypothetical protein